MPPKLQRPDSTILRVEAFGCKGNTLHSEATEAQSSIAVKTKADNKMPQSRMVYLMQQQSDRDLTWRHSSFNEPLNVYLAKNKNYLTDEYKNRNRYHAERSNNSHL